MSYASKTDIEDIRISKEKLRELLTKKVRIKSVDTTLNKITTVENHNLANNDKLEYETDGTKITPLNFNTDYFAKNITSDTLEISLTSGGSAIDLTGEGSGLQGLITFDNNAVDKIGIGVDALIDIKCGRRFSVPFISPIPEIIKKIAIDLRVYGCYTYRIAEIYNEVPTEVRFAYEQALKILDEIRDVLIDIPELEVKESSDAFKYSSTINNIMNTL